MTIKTADQNYLPGFELKNFLLAFVGTFLTPDFVKSQDFKNILYKPPLIFRDIPVLIQSFLL